MTAKEKFYHVTILSNFARGFEKYSRAYSKATISESTHPDRFFLLKSEELGIGIEKATRLQQKLGLTGNRLLVLETELMAASLQANSTNGRGQFIHSNQIALSGLYEIEKDKNMSVRLRPISIEDAMAASLHLLNREFLPFARIRPRAISFLPIALACQARCPFCFSKASISKDQSASKLDWEKISAWLEQAQRHGAERAVITGGGEPTLLAPDSLEHLIKACVNRFNKVVLITNGHSLATTTQANQVSRLSALYDAGLKVLAISCHHFDAGKNEQLMRLHTPVEQLVSTWRKNRSRWPELEIRFICVLQVGGVENEAAIEGYSSWAANQGVEEICFKELYVSTSAESVYHDNSANEWSRCHQVPLSLVTRFAEQQGFFIESRLPWGAPVYRGKWQNQPLRVAAYTEPSLFWERSHGVARSWNIMADGRCHVSLEDRASEIKLEEVE